MTSVTLALSDDLAQRLRPLEPFLSTVLELSLVGFQTAAAATATEVIQFLSGDPSPKEILAYHASERTQERTRRLLALNQAGLLSEEERRKLDEFEKIEHLVRLLKAQAAVTLKAA
ncbi:MAG: hypothetical protein ABJC13_06775 [Acidobacteriota bacterium]